MRRFFYALLLLCLAIGAPGQSIDTLRLVDQLLSRWNNATPGGAVAISRKDKVIYHKAFGLADLEHNIPNTTETIFESGSVAKQFTAMSILLLASDGKLSLQDEIQKYVPEVPRYGAPIKIQHLLNHTSGLKDWGTVGGLAGWPRTTRVYTQDLALQIISRQKSLNFTPGNEYSYSNSNYTLLVTIIERVSTQSLAQFTRERLFEPLGMSHTKWRDNFREVIPNRAIAYSFSGGVFQQEMPFENIHGHGGLLTTTADLIRWNLLLENHQIGGDPVFSLRIKKGRLNNGQEISYAGGLSVETLNGPKSISHSGATAGYRAWLAYYPQKKLSVAILSNDGRLSPASLGRQIAEIFLGHEKENLSSPNAIVLSESELKKFEGIYKSVRGFDVLTLDLKDGKIISNQHALIPTHRDTLHLDGLKWIWKSPDQIVLRNRTDTMTYVRKKQPQLNPTFLKAIEGDYQSEEADVTFSVQVKEDLHEVWIRRKPSTTVRINAAYQDGFLAADLDLYEFKRDQQGKVSGFEVSMPRAERITFSKVEKKK